MLNSWDLNTYFLSERIQQTHFCEDDAPPTVDLGIVLRRHATDGGREELVKKRSGHVGITVGIIVKNQLDGRKICAFGDKRGKNGCGVCRDVTLASGD